MGIALRGVYVHGLRMVVTCVTRLKCSGIMYRVIVILTALKYVTDEARSSFDWIVVLIETS
jgi:hypothetical protein